MSLAPVDALWNARDYRAFLRGWFESERERRRGFSLAVMGRRLSLDSSLVGRILQGERHLATSRIQPVCDLIGLSGAAAEFFRCLVLHAKSKTAREAQALFERMQELRRIAPVTLDDSQATYWDSWIHLALRSLLSCGEFRDEWERMGELLHPRQSARTVREAMKTLQGLGLVARDEGGVWRPVDAFVKDRPGVHARALRNFHRQSLLLALEALEGLDPSRRSLSAATFTVDAAEQAELLALIDDFRSRVLTRASKVRDPDRVVQLNLQLIPLAGEGIREGGTSSK